MKLFGFLALLQTTQAQDCDCSWTHGGSDCGQDDGSRCWQQCCGSGPGPSPSPSPSPSGGSGTYCLLAGDLVHAYGDGVQINDGGWAIQGDGGAATAAAFDLTGGSVEFDFDVSGANIGVIPNIYTISPNFGGSFSQQAECDMGDNDLPDCLEVDWIEANGNCGGATTLHTHPGTGDGVCNYWGCRTTYNLGNSKFHMKIDYDSNGKLTINRDGQIISGDSLSSVSSSDWDIVKQTYQSTGAVLYSSQWTGGWVPADFCGGGPGDLGGSRFEISNLMITGTVKQGPEPNKCSGPTPSPAPTPPSPAPTPSPAGQCQTFVGKNNDGTNLKSTADITTSADQCCGKCASADGCVGYTWVHENKECWLKSAVGSPRDDECGGCVTSGTYDGPAPTPAPTPAPSPNPPSPGPIPGCPGGSLAACVSSCPGDDPAVFKICVDECTDRCGGGSSCTGGDDGSDAASCMSNCPSEGFSDCVTCCTKKFPSLI